jgi:predicted nucleic acid-binding protein
MKRVFVDTSAWYALIDAKDPYHLDILDNLQRNQHNLLTSNYIVDETITLLRYKIGWKYAQQFGEQIYSGQLAQCVHLTESDERLAWDIFERYRDKVFSFTDCTSFSLMKRLQLSTAITLDSDFKIFGFHCLPNKN